MKEFYRKIDDPNYIIEVIDTNDKTGVLTARLQNGKQTKLTKGTLIRQYEEADENSFQKVDIE
jgi:hypothetical protein